MYNNLLTYIGIDEIEEVSRFTYKSNHIIDGYICIDEEVEDLLTFSIDKECISYKYIESFKEYSFDNTKIYGNIIIINNRFDLNVEYSNSKVSSRLNIFNKTIFKSIYLSLENINDENIDINLFIADINCSLLNKKLYYCINIIVCINEL